MTNTPDEFEVLESILNKCVVFAASEFCEDSALEKALKEFSLTEATNALFALDRLKERTQWRPIAKYNMNEFGDGEAVLCYQKGFDIYIGASEEGDFYFDGVEYAPTHFMPLPEPPKE